MGRPTANTHNKSINKNLKSFGGSNQNKILLTICGVMWCFEEQI